MSDQLYLSLWFPNFRFDTLPAALVAVLRQFTLVSKSDRVTAAAAYPISFSEPAVYQRVYVTDSRAADTPDTAAALIENAVAECTELLHEDTAYEFEMKWPLWTPDSAPGFDTSWKLLPTTVRFVGFGPEFDDATFEQNGHIRVDFGLDTPWTFEHKSFEEQSYDDEAPEDAQSQSLATQHIQHNVEMLLAFALSVQKHCNISARLLWTESGEPITEKLLTTLQRLN